MRIRAADNNRNHALSQNLIGAIEKMKMHEIRQEFKGMNSWEWSAIAIIALIYSFYIFDQFPLIGLCCFVITIISGAMALIRRKRRAVKRQYVVTRRVRIFRFRR